MAKLLLTILCFSLLKYQVLSQFLTRQVVEQPRNLIPQLPSPYPIIESPYNTFVPIPAPTSTTIITDCSPTACKNLANTLQLMIVANLLQNTNGGSELALQLAAPIINELFSSPTLSCGCVNPFAATPNIVAPSVVSPNIVSPSAVSPNIYSLLNNPALISSLAGALSASPGVLNFV
ncbi:hypothetical protein ABMA27_010890 [Loxostege sticticalis]|uniref:Uncharacterized protein n=1 Tax=Loxostege sticticalis TaxID=481309 RepID=A0ABR3H2K1_LOXSC